MNEDISSAIKNRQHHLDAVKKLAAKIPRLRVHALTPNHWLALARLHQKIAEHSGNANLAQLGTTLDDRFVRIVQKSEKVTPNLFRAERVKPEIPEPLLNPLTKQPIPFPDDMTERGIMKTRFPKYYEWAEAMAQKPLKALADHQDALTKFAQHESFYQNFDPNAENPWRTGNHNEQIDIAKSDPIRAEFLETESLNAAALPFDPQAPNQTSLGAIAKDNEALGSLLQEAQLGAAEWAGLESKAEEADARKLIESAKKLGLRVLGPGQTEDHRHASQRKPMKVAPFGSKAQEKLQKEAAAAKSVSETPLTAHQ